MEEGPAPAGPIFMVNFRRLPKEKDVGPLLTLVRRHAIAIGYFNDLLCVAPQNIPSPFTLPDARHWQRQTFAMPLSCQDAFNTRER
jgi:hypothetical protein